MPWLTDQNGFTYWEPDEGYGGGAPIISPVTNPPEPEPEPPPPPPPAPAPPDSGWKPDFTAPDPWAGMPPDYGGIGTYVPDPDSGSTVPPWEQPAPGGGTQPPPGVPKFGTPEYQERAAEIADKVIAPFKEPDGTIDVAKVAEAGKVEYLRPLGVDEAIIKQAQSYVADMGRRTPAERDLAAFRNGDGYDVAGAVAAGKTTQLKALGFTAEQIEAGKQYAEYKGAFDKDQAEFEKDHVFIAADPEVANSRGTWITQKSFDALPKEAQRLILDKGLTALETYYGKTANDAAKILPADVLAIYKDQSPEDKFAILKAYGVVSDNAEYVKADPQGNPIFKEGSGRDEAIINSSNIPLLATDVLVPGFATVRHWNEMGAGEKALSIALDALILIPMAGAAAKGAKASYAVTRTGRVLAAAKGIGAEAVAQLIAPVDMVLHPVRTVKGTVATGRDLLENIAHVKKIPEAVITTTYNTVRLPVSRVQTAADAEKIRDQVMTIAKTTGEDVVIEMNGQRFTLARSPLMRELGGGLAHATPMGEQIEGGLTVEKNLFFSHEPAPRFATQTAGGIGGTKPTIVILSPEIAKDTVSSGKLWAGTAEMESVLPPGYKVPAGSQRLFTRVGPQRTRVDILLVGEHRLSPVQIAKLKGLAVVEDLKQIVTPSLLVEGKAPKTADNITRGLSADEAEELARVLRKSGNERVARSLVAASTAQIRPRVDTSDLIATGSIRTPGSALRQPVSISVSGRPRASIERTATDEPIVYRRSPGTTEGPGRVDLAYYRPENRPGRTKTPESPRGDRTPPPDRGTPRVPDRGTIERPPARTPDRGRTEKPPDDGGRRPPPDKPRRTPPGEPPRTPPREPPRTPPSEPPRRPPDRPPDGSGRGRPQPLQLATDKTKRDTIVANKGAIAWRQGEVSDQGGGRDDVWHVILSPYTAKADHITVVGRRPANATIVRGPKSAYRTAQMLYGKHLSEEVRHDVGLFDVNLVPISGDQGIKLSFAHDPSISGTAKVFPLEKKVK